MIHYSVTTESWVFADVTRGHTFSSFFLFYVFKASLFFKKMHPNRQVSPCDDQTQEIKPADYG